MFLCVLHFFNIFKFFTVIYRYLPICRYLPLFYRYLPLFLGSAGRAEPFKSAAPLRGQGVWNPLSDSCRLSSVLVRLADALPADPAQTDPPNALLAARSRNFFKFWPTFRRSKIHQKSDSSKSHPKSQKYDP